MDNRRRRPHRRPPASMPTGGGSAGQDRSLREPLPERASVHVSHDGHQPVGRAPRADPRAAATPRARVHGTAVPAARTTRNPHRVGRDGDAPTVAARSGSASRVCPRAPRRRSTRLSRLELTPVVKRLLSKTFCVLAGSLDSLGAPQYRRATSAVLARHRPNETTDPDLSACSEPRRRSIVEQNRKPGAPPNKDITDLKARLGLKRPEAAAPPGAAPAPGRPSGRPQASRRSSAGPAQQPPPQRRRRSPRLRRRRPDRHPPSTRSRA